MKIVTFNGSPAGPDSNTHVIASAFLKGACRGGAQTENIFLTKKDISHCKGCFHCWFQSPGKCVMNDDMTGLLNKYTEADIVCFATPVYTWNMTALLKNFVDRLAPLKSPVIAEKNGNFDLNDATPKKQEFVVISNCGFPGENNFDVMKAVFACCNPILELYRNCGKLLKSHDEKVIPIVNRYLTAVELAGYEMATRRTVCAETKSLLKMPLMSVPDYVTYLGM